MKNFVDENEIPFLKMFFEFDDLEKKKKYIKGLRSNWQSLDYDQSVEYSNIYKNEDIQPNVTSIILNTNSDLIVFDTDGEESYNLLVSILKESNIYDKENITRSLTGQKYDIKYKRHFYFIMDKKLLKYRNDLSSQNHKNKNFNKAKFDVLFCNQMCYEFNESKLDYDLFDIMTFDIYERIINDITKLNNELSDKPIIEIKKEKSQKDKKTIIETQEEEEIKKPIKDIINNIKEEHFLNKNLIIELINILNVSYSDGFEFWRNIGMILKKIGKNINFDFFELFDKFSKRSKKYNKEDVKKFWETLNDYNITINIGTLFYYAKLSNENAFKTILSQHAKNVEITDKFIVEFIKKIAGEYFIFVKGVFYSFNPHNKLWFKNENGIFKKFVNDQVYETLRNFLNDSITDNRYLDVCLKELKRKCTTIKGKKELFETYDERFKTNLDHDNISFDMKPYLLGFSNGVYDLQKNIFRSYEYSDYVTLNTGYEYKEAKKNDIDFIKNIIAKIETREDKRKLLYQIMASGIIGKQYQKFIIFNGSGANGKSTIIKLMELGLGNNYVQTGNVKTLCESRKQGANTELANLHKKRVTLFNEPEKTDKIKNGLAKELTGDTTINARQLWSTDDVIILQNTLILLCNKRIYFENEPTDGEIRRIIDYLFDSKFVNENDGVKIDNIKIFQSDSRYQDKEFLEAYKLAFINILIEEAHKFIINGENFDIPKIVQDRSTEYIKKSYVYLEYLNNLAEKTDNQNDFIKIHDLFEALKQTEIYTNSTKLQKREITLKSIIEFFETNQYTSNFYCARKMINGIDNRNILTGFKMNYIFNNE